MVVSVSGVHSDERYRPTLIRSAAGENQPNHNSENASCHKASCFRTQAFHPRRPRLPYGPFRPQEMASIGKLERMKGRMLHHNVVRKVFHALLKAAGVRRARLHDLRHTFASLLLQNGESPATSKNRWATGPFR